VKAGEVLAEIDPAPYRIRLDQDRANEARARADVERVEAGLIQAEKELRRARRLAQKELIAPADADLALATYDSLAAQLKTAHAVVAGAQAAVEASDVNLKYCTILSPIDGIVISRNVDVGQTVSAGLQAPTLFLISGSLARIQILASVSESDIGKIREDQKVGFTVEAYRDDMLHGRVHSIRMSSVTVQNVVTYAVVISCRNPDEKLLPGMTATVSFLLSEHKDVLRIPNAAFRYKPDPKALLDAPLAESTARVPGRREPSGNPDRRRVWCLIEGKLAPRDIECGETDGTRTRVIGDLLRDGQEIVIGIAQADAPATTPTPNPFIPPPRQRLR
jgi:HlyD family secretion protein